MDTGAHLLAANKKARHNYNVHETLECGIELLGSEVKSMKEAQFSFVDSYCEISSKGELFIRGFHITPYAHATLFVPSPERVRRLLAHKKEILKWQRKVHEKGVTIIPLRFYLKRGFVKIEIGLCSGKKLFDKRATIKARDEQRDTERAVKRYKG